MPDPGTAAAGNDPARLLAAARQHFDEAVNLADARMPTNPTENALILLGLAQTEALLSIAGQLANGVGLSAEAERALDGLSDAVGEIKALGSKLRNL